MNGKTGTRPTDTTTVLENILNKEKWKCDREHTHIVLKREGRGAGPGVRFARSAAGGPVFHWFESWARTRRCLSSHAQAASHVPQLEGPTTKNIQLCTRGLWGEKGKNKIFKKKKERREKMSSTHLLNMWRGHRVSLCVSWASCGVHCGSWAALPFSGNAGQQKIGENCRRRRKVRHQEFSESQRIMKFGQERQYILAVRRARSWGQILASLLTSYVTLGKLPNFSVCH